MAYAIELISTPVCPQCGCIPRRAIGIFKLAIKIDHLVDDTYEIGKPTSVRGTSFIDILEFECGGGHTWESTFKKAQE